MKNKRLNPWGSILIILGILIPAAAFFVSLWQSHPDPSAFSPGELGDLKLLVLEGTQVFESEETGELLPLTEIPFDPDNESAYIQFIEENVFEKGRVEVRVIYIMLAGVLMIAAGAGLSLKDGA